MKRLVAVFLTVIVVASCGGGPGPIDEDAFLAATDVAIGGPDSGILLITLTGRVTAAGEDALATGYLACEMPADELNDYFFETWPYWEGPKDAPDGIHAAAREHLCR